jgi:hypothetical protein
MNLLVFKLKNVSIIKYGCAFGAKRVVLLGQKLGCSFKDLIERSIYLT